MFNEKANICFQIVMCFFNSPLQDQVGAGVGFPHSRKKETTLAGAGAVKVTSPLVSDFLSPIVPISSGGRFKLIYSGFDPEYVSVPEQPRQPSPPATPIWV